MIAADPTARTQNWYFDAAVLQLYNNPRGLFDASRIFQDLMRTHGIFNKPVWINETNVVPWDDPVAPLELRFSKQVMLPVMLPSVCL